MAIITLTSDHGKQDHYTASVKGVILNSGLEEVNIVDISHSIRPFDIYEAAYILKESYAFFPKGTIHLVSVNDGISENQEHILMCLNGQFFLSADNGIFSILSQGQSDVSYYSLTTKINEGAMVFPLRERLVEAACHLARGGTPEVIGSKKDTILHAEMVKPLLDPDVIRGHVAYVDGYENAITNISHQTFRDIGKGRSFSIRLVKFKEMFKDRKDRIRNFPGCSHLKLLQGIDSENIFFTYSHWNSADDLENYRNSSFFKETWSITKGFFGLLSLCISNIVALIF